MARDKVDDLYDNLKEDGWVENSREHFREYFLAPGKKGYENRRALYENMKEDGYVDSPTYEEFARRMGLGPMPPGSQNGAPVKSPQPAREYLLRSGGKNFWKSESEVLKDGGFAAYGQKHGGAPLRVYMTNKQGNRIHVDASKVADKSKEGYWAVARNTQQLPAQSKPKATQTARKPSSVQRMAMSQQLQQMQSDTEAMFDSFKERRENLKEYYSGGKGFGFQTVKSKPVWNARKKKVEQTYLTPTGERTTSKAVADMSSRQFRDASDMSVGAQIRRAYREREELNRKAEERLASLTQDKDSGGVLSSILSSGDPMTGAVSAMTSHNTQRIMEDPEYQQYRQAIRELNTRIQTLENKRYKEGGGDVGFWRGFGQTVSNVDTWVGTSTGFLTANAKLSANSAPKTESAQALIKATADNEAVQNEYGDFGFWHRAGIMTGEMVPFMVDFAITGGGFDAVNVAGKAAAKGTVKLFGKEAIEEMTKMGVKAYAKKYGVRGVGRMAGNWTVKALGTTADDLLIRAPLMTNTVQIGKTTADIIDRKLGDVVVDENGNYDFSNDKTWGSAVWQGEANSIIENYSEMFGTHLEGVVPALAKTFGGKRISGMLARANASNYGQILATTRKQFQRLGVSDYLGEVSEEYYGQLWRTMLNLDDAYKQNPDGSRTNLFFDGQFHGDIWGGMALSMGLMGAGKYAISGAAYGNMKHQVNKADKIAAEIFTPDRWESIRELIDNTTNDDIGALAENMVNDQNLSDDERSAVMEYMERSLNLRGLNLGTMAKSRGNGVDENEQALNEAYIDGYEAQTSQEMTDAQNMYNVQRQRIEGMFGADDIAELDRNPVLELSRMANTGLYSEAEVDAARDYINAKVVVDGMKQRVSDDIDEQIARKGAEITSLINVANGMIQPAIMGGTVDKEVYIVDGNIVLTEDGQIDREASDATLIVRDKQTGKVEFTDPKSIISVGDSIDPQEERAMAADNIRQQAEREAENKMNGTLSMNPGDVVTIKVSTGTHQVTVVGPAMDEEGQITDNLVVRFEDGSQYDVEKATLQKLADDANLERVNQYEQERAAQRAQQRVTESEARRPKFALNDEFTIKGPDGEAIQGTITGELNEDGLIEVTTDEPISGNMVNQFTPEEFMGIVDTYNGNVFEQSTDEEVVEADNSEQSDEQFTQQYNNGETPINDYVAIPEQEPSAFSQIPVDEQGQPILTEAAPDIVWDALVERAQGDEAIASEVAADYLEDAEGDFKTAEKELKKIKDGKPEKRKTGIPSPTLDERIAAKEAVKAALAGAQEVYDNAKAVRDHWQRVVGTVQRRQDAIRVQQEAEARQRAAERAEAEKAEREAREEAARLEREALEGIPEWHLDTPENARKRGARRFSGKLYQRQEPVQGAIGKDVEVKFAKDVLPKGKAMLVEASQLQPSHMNGNPNPMHFIPEAQPKRRTDDVSKMSASDMADNMRPEEITGGYTAYTGSPSVNARGEAIQGNGRLNALKLMYERNGESAQRYKQFLHDHAADFGLTAEQVDAMQQPVLVNMFDVDDATAIRLGQHSQPDIESGGEERIKAVNTARALGANMRTFANMLLRSVDEEASFGQLVSRNGEDVLKWMNQIGAITPTQYKSAHDSKGNLTDKVKDDLMEVLYQSIFQGANEQLQEMFYRLPAKAQRAILGTAFRDMDSPFAGKMLSEIQSSIVAYTMMVEAPSFAAAKKMDEVLIAVDGFKRSYAFDDRLEQVLPADNFSNFALHLAAMYKASDMSQKTITSYFNQMYDLAQGKKEATLFEGPDTTKYPLADIVKQVLNIDYQPAKNGNNNVTDGGSNVDLGTQTGEGGQLRGTEPPASGEQTPQTEGTPERGGGTASNSGQGLIGRSLTAEEAETLIKSMEASAEQAQSLELTPENWIEQFGEDGRVDTPMGEVKLGENQFIKLYSRGRAEYFGMMRPTLVNPDVIIEKNAPAEGAERDTKYIFVKTFTKADGSRIVHFESITVRRDGMEVSVSSHEAEAKDIKKDMQNGKILHISNKLPLSSEWSLTEAPEEGPDLVPTPDSVVSDDKDNTSSSEKQENDGKSSLGQQIEEASKDVNTNPSEGQKEAGNYKKGHVQVGTFDVTIEQPVGSIRRNKDANGKEWETEMKHTYGYIRGSEGVDGDHIDVFISADIDGWNGRKAFVVDQYNPDGSFDEHKVMLGFNDKGEAFAAYLANYEKGWEKGRRLDCTEVNMEDFEKWIASSHRKTKPFTEYKSVKPAESAHSAIYQQNYDKFFNSYLQAIENNQIPDVKAIKAELAKIKKSIKTIEDGMAVNVNSDEDRIKAETRLEQLYGLRDAYAAALADIEKRMNGTEDSNFTLEDIEALREYNYNFAKRDESHKGLTASAIKEKIKSLEKDVEELLSIGYFATKSEAYGKQGIIRYLKELLADTEAKDEAQGYTVDEYTDRKKRKYFRVKFPRADKNVWKQRLNLAEKMGGAKVPLGYGFATKEEAEAFADKVMNDPKALADAQPLSLDDVKTATGMQEVNLEGVIKDLQEHGETNLADHSTRVEATPTEQKPTESEPEKKPVNPSGNKLVTDEQYEALLKRLKDKMGGQLNMGVDPEILAIGVQLAVYHIEKGARKFAAYVKALSADLERMGILDQFPKRYLKGFYKNAHEMLEEDAPELASEMDSDEEVNRSDVATIISGHTDPLATAEVIAGEQEAEEERKKAEEELKRQREEREASDKWIYDIKRGAGGELTLTRMTDSPVPIEDGRFRITARNVAELEGIIKNPANGLEYVLRGKTEIYKDVSVLLGMLRHEETHKGDQAKTDGTLDLAEPETKDAKELEGDSAQFQKAEQQRNALVSEIALNIEMRVQSLAKDSETKPLTMTEVKKLAKGYIELKGIADTDLQELVELAMTQLTRKVARDAMFKSAEEQRIAYDTIVKYYRMQPSLNARDSERLMKQQYSTPTPFGFVMGQFLHAGGNVVMSMLEPSAGNGALTIAVSPSAVHANDIDEARLANLRKLKFGKVTAQDALLPFGFGIYDAISTNPPFGTVAERVYDGVFKISSLEGQMAINALDAMKDNGRAAIVIGGNTSYRKNGSMNPKDAAFFGYLYSHYNVADVINISGKALYSRNGTGYDVRIILIDGRKEGAFKRTFPPVQADARAEQITTFEELYNRVQDDILRIQEQNNGTAATDVQSEAQPTADGGSRAAIRNGSHSTDGGQRGQSGTGSPVRGGSPRVGTQQPVGGHDTAGADGLGDGHRGDAGNTHAVQGGNSGQNSGGLSTGSVGDGGRRSRGTEPQQPSAQSDNNRERLAIKPDLGTEKVDYPAQSGNGFTLLSVVPAAQADVLRKSLGEIGDVDQFLVDELGYSSKEELYGYLAAEQIDSVALAINQMNQGNAFIIGDMTGVGKGRQGAALIRYAVKHGKKPIYFTQKPTLFTDNYRDLADIGSGNLRPFIIASDPKEANIVDADGKVVHRLPSKKEKERVFKYIMEHGTLPDEYDYALCTYSQVQNGTSDYEQRDDGTWQVKPKSSKGGKAAATDAAGQIRRDVLSALAQGNYVYLDESHTVGGDSGCGRYMQMLTSATEGVTFLSATFAKRADNMPIYAQRTDLSRAEITPKELIAAIAKGGVTLQEIMSRQLVESGQMIRRERSFEGVNIDWLPVPEETDRKQRAQFNEVAEIFNAIRNFQDDYITPLIEAMSGEAAGSGGYVDHTKGTKDMGVQNTPFASKMYNLVNQLLFALKVDAVADRVVENLRNGFKPVISFTNTMEGFLEEAPIGVEMDEMPHFSLTLQRALDGVMRFTETDADNNKTSDSISFGQLTQAGQQAYNAIRERIAALSADLPISPMDALRIKIEEAGYTVREITGRELQLAKTEDGKYVVKSREDRDKKAAMRDFNNGQLDVLMINKSGSTGISLHASSKFADQRQRVMVFAQFQSDINDEVQMRGRIDRSGQVVRGRYEYIMSSIPAEQRLQMMFKAKLKSLDANTTSSQKSKFNEMEVVDYLNKYGDEVVWEYMKEHPELSERLGDPLDMLSDDKENGPRTRDKENKKKKNDCAAKLSRYLAFLPVEEQDEIFKEITDAYRVKIQLLDDAGENDLEITTMPLRAKTKSRKMWHEGSEPGGRNSFADNTYVEEVEVDVLKKPMKRAEILEQQRKLLGEEFVDEDGTIYWDRYKRKKGDEITTYYVAKADETIAKLTEQGEARIAKAKEKAIKDAITLRAQGKNNLTDEQIRQLGDEVANEQREKEETKRQNRRAEILGPQARIRGLMNRFRAGTIYAIPNDLANATPGLFTPTFATFVGFKFNKTYTIGSSTAIFATLDGRRKVEVSLRDKALDTIYESTNNAYRYARNEINSITMENWDSKVPTQTRAKRYIITGNLLQALVDTEKGEKTRGNLISYSTIDGETRQGILMGENFKPADLRNSASLGSRLSQIREGRAVVSENGDVQIEKVSFGWQHRGQYELKVPKSKQRGGIYTMHPDLLKLVEGKNFITKGKNMVAYVNEADIAKVMEMLSRAPFHLTVVEESALTDVSSAEAEDDVLYRAAMANNRQDFDSTRERAIAERGLVKPGLNEAEVMVTQVERHPFTGANPIAQARKWAKDNIAGVHTATDSRGVEFEYSISNSKIDKYLSESAIAKSENLGIHLSVLTRLPEIIDKSIEAEIHPDYRKADGVRSSKNEVSPDVLIHRFYGAVEIDGKIHRVKTTMQEHNPESRSVTAPHSFEVIKIEVLEKSDTSVEAQGPSAKADRILGIAKLLKGVEKSYDSGKKLLDESEKTELERQGDGYGAYSDAEVSYVNDPVSRVFGKNRFSKRRQAEFATRERQRMVGRIQELAERMHLDNVEILTDASQLEGKRAKAKGFYNKRSGKITIVLPNNYSTIDAEQTLLHEAVAHYGLRQLFGKQFDTFLDNVYEAADESIRRKIAETAAKNGWDFRTATEEYLAGLAEDIYYKDAVNEGWWSKIKSFFIDMLEMIGFEGFRDKAGVVLTDNELRYILWRSYENLAEPGRYRSILGEAADIAKQAELKVGNYADGGIEAEYAAEDNGIIDELSVKFDEGIDAYKEGKLPVGFRFDLGMPSKYLRSAGFPNMPISLRASLLSRKAGDERHPYQASDLKGLVDAIQKPIAVFSYSKENMRNLIVDIARGNKHFLVGVTLNYKAGDIEINSVSGLFPKESHEWVKWIQDGKAIRIDNKEKVQRIIDSLRTNPAESERIGLNLEDVAKVIKSFENPTIEEEELFRPGDFTPRDKVTARDTYERIVSSGSYQFQEAVQDSMLGLKKLYQAILGKETRIEDVAGFENAYLFENRMSGMNAGEQHEYFQRYMKPLLKEIGRIAGTDKRKRRDLTDYIMAKHGLERNEYMRNEAANNGEDTDRDFAGLTGLTGEADWRSAEATAKQWVDDYEAAHDVSALWTAINGATKATLEKVYLSGIINKETYGKILGMYRFYVPLRGWNHTTSDEVYGYLTCKEGPLGGSIMKKAEGRESMADDPIATIGMMADDAIRQGNRNLMKQRFLNFILNHPSDAVSVHDIWLEYDDAAGEWKPVFADIDATDTADEVEQKVEAFEQRMEALRQAKPGKYKKGREAQHIPYKVVKGNLREHQILIKRNGRTFVATINGNPRAAQALNGLTNPDVDQNGVVGNMLKAGEWINRQLSAFYTTRNPDFVISNFFRDMLYSNCMTWVKESPQYARRFRKNFGRVNPVVMRRLLGKWESGTLEMKDEIESLFYQFMKNGGETGYTNVRDIEGHKRAVAAELKKQGSAGRRAWTALGMQLDLLNRSAENCARFAAFVTSREFGRNIDRAIYDAKEISVNFNKKGSGGKMVNANGQTVLGKIGAYLGGGGRIAYVFWNAGIQGMTNFGRQAKLHPIKFTAGAAAMFTLGYVIPLLTQMLVGGDGDDDDKNAYYNLPEYIRRSNICFYAGAQWVTIPLPIEFRAMYGMGELAYGVISGNERYSNEELARQMAAQVSQIFPLDMLEGGGGVSPLIPSALKPFTEAYIMNKGWTGLPVYKDTPFNKNEPEWTKAYASADKHLVSFAKWLNETSGGNDFKKGSIDINPAKVEYLLNGTFGGLVTFPNKIMKTGETIFGDRDFEWRNIPIANRLIKSGDERTANRKLQNEYFKYNEEYKETGRLMRKYQNASEKGIVEYAQLVNLLENSDEYLRYEIFDAFKDNIDAYREGIAAETDEEQKSRLEAEMYSVMRQEVDALHNPTAYLQDLYDTGQIDEEYVKYLKEHHGIVLRRDR